ncbi:MAG: M14 metallopeptidase family protein [Pseudomonadota bacterium]
MSAAGLRLSFSGIIGAVLAAALTLSPGHSDAQTRDPILPADHSLDSSIPTPASLLGYQVGDWHVHPDQLMTVMQALADASPKATLEEIGRTHERRPQMTLAISDPKNLTQLETLRQRHLAGEEDAPLVLWFGYSIHGNEASGSNAAMLFAYLLLASQSPEITDALQNTVVFIDPVLNPDGLGRFASWVNSHRSTSMAVPERSNREHQEAWPGGRFNHYWFDLNRDWLPLVHPESRARVAFQQRWRPHVVTDFHEMGSDQTYFFQPGVLSRRHPLTPQRNVDLTAGLARFHARALDALGQGYYSEEGFDDFYYGKGSTYPDAQGTIGILFEQASARGHLMATRRGELSFRTAIRNQFTTSMSTLRGSVALADELKTYQRGFDDVTLELARTDPHAAYVVGDDRDPQRALGLLGTLLRHQIRVYELATPIEIDGQSFEPGRAWLVPVQQPKYRLLKSLFEKRTEFADNTFYDVSAWHLPLAYDLPWAPVKRIGKLQGEPFEPPVMDGVSELPVSVAYAIPWHQQGAPATLNALLKAEVPVVAATREFNALVVGGERRFDRGTLVVYPPADQALEPLLKPGVEVVPLTTGLTPSGPDLGSPSLLPLDPVRPLLLVGRGVDPQSAGDAWHLLDTRVGLPPVMVETHQLRELALHRYTHLLLVDGDYARLDETLIQRISQWVQGGGVLIASQRAAAWATKNRLHLAPENGEELAAAPAEESSKGDETEPPALQAYGDYSRRFADSVIGGTVVNTDVDLTHPLAYGLQRPHLPLLRRGTVFLKVDDNPYQTPYRYSEQPLLSGFLGPERTRQMAGSAAVVATAVGAGKVIRLADNPNFRGFWLGGNRLYLNALFFSQLIKATPLADTETRH